MPGGITSYAFPTLDGPLDVAALPTQRWVECVSCKDNTIIKSDTEAEVFAEGHMRALPHHDRFNVCTQAGFKPRARDV
ncbi:hypothetical protein [Streptomyces sp. NPDC126514]|uniref:hypothetical protein n=1 Tax=Streptomyces sp. NPDC126514 TaxID=3155210 RepID=UPI0033186788